MSNNFLIEGDDAVLIREEEKRIINSNGFSSITPNIYDLDEVELGDAIEDLDTYGLFSSKKVIIIREIDNIKYDDNKTSFDHLFKYLDNPNNDNLLIIEAVKLDGKLRITKELRRKCSTISTNLNSKSFIRGLLKDYEIGQNAINLLDEYCAGDFTKISNECHKLKDYKLDDRVINVQDIVDIVPRKEVINKDRPFEFTRALASKNIPRALSIFNELLENDSDAIGIIGLLASQFRIMLEVKILEGRRMSDREIANMLGEKEFRIKKTREVTRFFSESEIINLINSLKDIDIKVKSTDTSPRTLIDTFIMNI